jgi:superfamily II DNA helicase RecQ
MNDSALSLLQTTFGYAEFRGEQATIVAHVASGKSALVLMPTGGGKSLCYQIPALLRDGLTVVISPLIALMQNQVAALLEVGVTAATLNNASPYAEQQRIIAAARAGELKLLYVSPERLLSTKRIASANGGTIFDQNINSLVFWRSDFPASPVWRSPRPPTNRRAKTFCTFCSWNRLKFFWPALTARICFIKS